MEAIIAIVGFLGAGKTTLLKDLAADYLDAGWNPFIILNDYENAHLDAQQLSDQIERKWVKALSGSCICCSGITQLRECVNDIPIREKGITLIEANGTTDACQLMGFLGVGITDRFLPPVQVSVVDVKNWQKRREHNELEANQIQVSSLIVLTHHKESSHNRLALVVNELEKLNPLAKILTTEEIDVSLLPELSPSNNEAQKFLHQKTHWASCSVDLPNLPDSICIEEICAALPTSILRVKGCTRIGSEERHTYFERLPDGKMHIRPFNGVPTTGSKLLIVGPGSGPEMLKDVISASLDSATSRQR